MTDIKLFEYEPTRSQKCHWALAEAGLEYESIGNSSDTIGSAPLREVHPLGKLPAAVIDGKPLFESSAIVTAIADLVPERHLIGKPGSWERTLHDQWTSFCACEMEMWAWSTMLNTWDFLLPEAQRVPAIAPQNEMLYKRGASAVNDVLASTDYIIGNRFTVTDIIVGYVVKLGRGIDYIGEFEHLNRYLDRLLQREHCALR